MMPILFAAAKLLADAEVAPSIGSALASANWLQMGSFGVLVAMLYWGVRYGIPRALDIHKEMLASANVAHEAAVSKITTAHETTVNRLTDSVAALTSDFRGEMKMEREWAAAEFDKRDAAIKGLADAVGNMRLASK